MNSAPTVVFALLTFSFVHTAQLSFHTFTQILVYGLSFCVVYTVIQYYVFAEVEVTEFSLFFSY